VASRGPKTLLVQVSRPGQKASGTENARKTGLLALPSALLGLSTSGSRDVFGFVWRSDQTRGRRLYVTFIRRTVAVHRDPAALPNCGVASSSLQDSGKPRLRTHVVVDREILGRRLGFFVARSSWTRYIGFPHALKNWLSPDRKAVENRRSFLANQAKVLARFPSADQGKCRPGVPGGYRPARRVKIYKVPA